MKKAIIIFLVIFTLAAMLCGCSNNQFVEELKSANVGDYVFFGSYEQDNDTSNGKEKIEWLVLEKKDGRALVISKYALDTKQYNTSQLFCTWDNCSLRGWLNNDFIDTAFSAGEKEMIPTVTVSADMNPEYSTNPGNATQDQVFLLSIDEANKYFNSNTERVCEATAYTVANGAFVWESSAPYYCGWWLRTSGKDLSRVADVNTSGGIVVRGEEIYLDIIAVRPAMWIDYSN